MKHNIVAASILALGLIAAALVYTGRYHAVRLDGRTVARMDRWTGEFTVCTVDNTQTLVCSKGEWHPA